MIKSNPIRIGIIVAFAAVLSFSGYWYFELKRRQDPTRLIKRLESGELVNGSKFPGGPMPFRHFYHSGQNKSFSTCYYQGANKVLVLYVWEPRGESAASMRIFAATIYHFDNSGIEKWYFCDFDIWREYVETSRLKTPVPVKPIFSL